MLQMLKTLLVLALTAPPFLLVLVGCSFEAYGGAPRTGYTTLEPGPEPHTTGFFCNIPVSYTCATDEDIASPRAIRIDKQSEEGFWANRSGFGLDYSAEAIAACDGKPWKIEYQGTFPQGSWGCVNPNRFGLGMDPQGEEQYPDVAAACKSLCLEDNEDNYTRCDDAEPAWLATEPIANACTESGMLRPDFLDMRLLLPLQPVVWLDARGVVVSGSSLEKTAATVGYDSGAAAERVLAPKSHGAFEFTVFEVDRERMAGFAVGPRPDTDPTDADIAFAVVLEKGGVLRVKEDGQTTFTGTYATNDVIRIAVFGDAVNYFKNGARFYMGGTVPAGEALRVSVSLKDQEAGRGATITNAKTSF